MINKIKPKSEFTKNILVLMTGTTIAQAIPVVISPILTRLYTPEDFGIFALFFAIVVIIGSISTGRYEHAIMLPRKDEDAVNIFAIGFIITLLTSTFIFLIIFIFFDFFIKTFDYKGIVNWLFFIPISVFFIGFFNILNYFNNRKKNYKDISNSLILKALVLAFVQISIGVFKSGSIGLIIGEVLSRIFANLKLFKNILKDKILISSISKIKIIALSKKYKKFPFHNLPSSLANTGASYLPFLMLPKIFGLSVGGYFMLAQRIISLPSALIAKAFSQVLFQKMAENKVNKIANSPLLFNTIKKLTLIGFPIACLIFILSPTLFYYFFGKDWLIAGEIARYLSIVFFITFITSAISVSLLVYTKLKILAFWQYMYLFTTIILFSIFLFISVEIKEFLFYFILHELILYIIYFYIIVNTVVKMDKALIK